MDVAQWCTCHIQALCTDLLCLTLLLLRIMLPMQMARRAAECFSQQLAQANCAHRPVLTRPQGFSVARLVSPDQHAFTQSFFPAAPDEAAGRWESGQMFVNRKYCLPVTGFEP